MKSEHWSDHKAGVFEIEVPHMSDVKEKYEMVPCNSYLPKIQDMFRRTEQLHEGWTRQKECWQAVRFDLASEISNLDNPPSEAERQDMADQIWVVFNDYMERFFQAQAREAERSGVPMTYHQKLQRRKGAFPKVRRVPLVMKQLSPQGTTNHLRVWQKLWGQLCEAERHEHHDIPRHTCPRALTPCG
jgi:hypothetical protein